MPSNTSAELWTLYAFGVALTVLRTYARISAVGVRELRADDYLIWFAIVCICSMQRFLYSTLTILASSSTLRKRHSATMWAS